MPKYTAKLAHVKAFAFDMDGVLTDGSFLCLPDGDLLRSFYAKDGFAIRTAVAANYPIAIITGGYSGSILHRFHALGVKDIITSSSNKLPDFQAYCLKYDLQPSQVLYMGDDIPDIPTLQACGFACAPADAAREVIKVCDYVSTFRGGTGCVREVIEMVLRARNLWYS